MVESQPQPFTRPAIVACPPVPPLPYRSPAVSSTSLLFDAHGRHDSSWILARTETTSSWWPAGQRCSRCGGGDNNIWRSHLTRLCDRGKLADKIQEDERNHCNFHVENGTTVATTATFAQQQAFMTTPKPPTSGRTRVVMNDVGESTTPTRTTNRTRVGSLYP